MPTNLQQQLQQLRDQLANNPPLDDEERSALAALLRDIEANLQALRPALRAGACTNVSSALHSAPPTFRSASASRRSCTDVRKNATRF